MPKYLLALRDDPSSYGEMSPEKMQELIGKYEAWAGRLAQEGKLVGGHKLVDGAGRRMERPGGELKVVDGPFGETKEVLGGYYLIRADDYDDAVRLCEDHPIFLTGGSVEVRELDFMGQPDPDEG